MASYFKAQCHISSATSEHVASTSEATSCHSVKYVSSSFASPLTKPLFVRNRESSFSRDFDNRSVLARFFGFIGKSLLQGPFAMAEDQLVLYPYMVMLVNLPVKRDEESKVWKCTLSNQHLTNDFTDFAPDLRQTGFLFY